MRILGVIPARGGSKGIVNKNIKSLNGKPLIAYTIEPALDSKLEKVIVSTDCDNIAKVAKEYGAQVLRRPVHLAEDTTPTLPVIQHVLDTLKEKYDAVMILQATSPLRTVKDINDAINVFSDDDDADSLVSVVEVPHNYLHEKLMRYDGKYLIGTSEVKRRQEMPVFYARNGAAIYITRINRINEYIFGGKILPYFMSKFKSFDIDDKEDWKIMEKLI